MSPLRGGPQTPAAADSTPCTARSDFPDSRLQGIRLPDLRGRADYLTQAVRYKGAMGQYAPRRPSQSGQGCRRPPLCRFRDGTGGEIASAFCRSGSVQAEKPPWQTEYDPAKCVTVTAFTSRMNGRYSRSTRANILSPAKGACIVCVTTSMSSALATPPHRRRPLQSIRAMNRFCRGDLPWRPMN